MKHLAAAFALLLAASPAAAQQKPTIEPSDYDRWESLGSFELSPDGRWLAASIRRVDEATRLELRPIDDPDAAITLEHASGPSFSRDGRWLLFRQGVSPEEEEEAEDPVHDRLGLVDLEARTDTVLMPIQSAIFRDDGAWIAVLGIAPADTVGADLLVFRPDGGRRTTLASVEDFAWQDEGPLLAYAVRSATGSADGVTVYNPETGVLTTLDSGDARYRHPTWRDESSQLAVFRSVDDKDRDGDAQDVLVWNDPAGNPDAVHVLASAGRPEFGDTLAVSEQGGIEFSPDGATVFVGLRPWTKDESGSDSDDDSDDGDSDSDDSEASDSTATEDEEADVQVWHWDDDDILRMQESRASFDERRTLLTAWMPETDRLTVLGTEYDEPVRPAGDAKRWGVVGDLDPDHVNRRFGFGTTDWYRVDMRTGARDLIAAGIATSPEIGPAGHSVVLFDGSDWIATNLRTLEQTRFAGDPDPGTSGGTDEQPDFAMSAVDHDYPGPRRSWGVDAWLEDDEGAVLQGRYDLWRADFPDGALRRLTRGAGSNVRHRVLNLDPDASFFEPAVLGDGPTWLSMYNLVEKTQGYGVLADYGVDRRVWQDAAIRGLTKARSADRYAYRVERWDDSPDVLVTDESFDDPVQITETNPFQADFAWGRAELLQYTTDAGHDLQAVLVYPAGFEEGHEYPLILYQYEILSDGLHRFRVPNRRSYYDFQAWSQQGYFILMPDIVYEGGRPGPSALDAVNHALDAALATGHVDADRMGLVGHSWGGYQAAYLPTRTNRFAASVAGAAITDFISFPGTVHWSGGLEEFGHWETGQARMAVPPWEDIEGHLESSPLNFIADLETPVLLMHGDDDGVVDFRQGLQYYNYARRAGKEVVLLVYPGAGHGLREESQQVDYHDRILQWFGHFLKGEPAPRWITEGESWSERAERLEE